MCSMKRLTEVCRIAFECFTTVCRIYRIARQWRGPLYRNVQNCILLARSVLLEYARLHTTNLLKYAELHTNSMECLYQQALTGSVQRKYRQESDQL